MILKQSPVVHMPLILELRVQRQLHLHTFEASLIYVESSRTAKTIQ